MTKLTGFVFDLDGVITDTAKYHYQAWSEIAKKELNITITPAVNELLKGRSRMDSLNAIVHFGHQDGQHDQAELEAIASLKNRRYQSLIQNMTAKDILPGITSFLKALQINNYPLAVASASYNAPVIIERLGLKNILGKIVDPGSVANGKPAPDLFEAAADLIDSPYPTTVGVEDSEAGIQGIKAAGMFAVGIGNANILKQADIIFNSTNDVNLSAIQAAVNAI